MYGTIINQSINQSIETLARYPIPSSAVCLLISCVRDKNPWNTAIQGTHSSRRQTRWMNYRCACWDIRRWWLGENEKAFKHTNCNGCFCLKSKDGEYRCKECVLANGWGPVHWIDLSSIAHMVYGLLYPIFAGDNHLGYSPILFLRIRAIT